MNAMTEEEARGKWCPFTRDERSNRPIAVAPAECFPCLASACMAWRWWDGLSDDGTTHHRRPTPHTARVPEPPEGRPLDQRRGYCGLAGSPTP